MPTRDEGWEAAQEDYAIGATFGVPDETMGDDYRNGYVEPRAMVVERRVCPWQRTMLHDPPEDAAGVGVENQEAPK